MNRTDAPHLDTLTDLLEDILSEQDLDKNDLRLLCSCGERLRRALLMLEIPPQRSLHLLDCYDQRLAEKPALPDPGVALDEILAELTQAAAPEALTFQYDLAALLFDLEDQMCLAVARARAGLDDATQPEELGAKLSAFLEEHAAGLPQLWNFSAERLLAFAPDPDFPAAFEYLEPLAERSAQAFEVRQALGEYALLKQAEERQARLQPLIEETLQKLEHSSLVTRIRRALEAMGETLAAAFTLPALPQVVSYASAEPALPQEVKTLFTLPDHALSLSLQDNTLFLQTAEQHASLELTLVVADGTLHSAQNSPDNPLLYVLDLPRGLTRASLHLSLDGQVIDLPELRFEA